MRKTKRGSRPHQVILLVGTRKGAFVFRSDLRRRNWTIDGPQFTGVEINHVTRDARTGWLWAATNSSWFGSQVQVSTNGGKKWQPSSKGIGFEKSRGLMLNRVWHVVPDRESRPETLWCGVDPGALFRSDDRGRTWDEVRTLTDHPTRKNWQPGGGGMCTHTILVDPRRPRRMYVAISAAGCFRTDDDGATWRPMNKGVRADFIPNKFPEVGQCVHRMGFSPANTEVLFQQNHCGVYRSDNRGESWTDISKGLPSRFGFPIVVHPHDTQTIYVLPENGAEARYVCGGKFVVYRSRNGGRSWLKLTKGLPQKNCFANVLRHAATADACDDAGIYVGTGSGEIFYSRNAGNAWDVLASRLPTILSLEAAVV